MPDPITLDAVLERVAQLAGIASAKKPAFKDAAFFVLCFAEWSSTGGQSVYTPRDRKALRAIAKASLALKLALKQRTRRVENALLFEWLTQRQKRDGNSITPASRGEFSQWLEWPRLLADLAGDTHQREINRHGPNKRGAPIGFRNPIAYELATGLRDAAKEYGGKLTIDKSIGAGSLLTALELCRPLLPEGFRVPSAMTLDRMIKKKTPATAKSVRSKTRKSTAKKLNS